jgi:transposase
VPHEKGALRRGALEALRCLKRRISDAVYHQLAADARAITPADVNAGPGGHFGASQISSAAGSNPLTGTSDQPFPGPAPTTLAATRAHAQPRPGSAPQQTRRRAGAVKMERPTGRMSS